MKGFSTAGLHGFKENRKNDPHVLPIYATSSFNFDDLEESIEVFKKEKDGHVYTRYGNPTIQAVEQQLASLETLGTDINATCLLTSSGMSAIHVLLSTLLSSGEVILAPQKLYGGTTELFNKVLNKQNIKIQYLPKVSADSLENKLKAHPEIKLIYLETPSNPTLECIDLKVCVSLAQKYNVLTVLDNTFCTPFLQQGIPMGIDYAIYSTTKYLNGHGNSIAGAIVSRHKEKMKNDIWQHLKLSGATTNAFDAWLVHNGLKTLEIRMLRHNSNAIALAKYLESHSEVERVYYPGLMSHPTFDIANRQMQNGFGGMLSFILKRGRPAVVEMINKLKIVTYAPTLGDVDTLIMHPESSSHLNIPEADRIAEGVVPGLVRISVGIENIEDILDDFRRSLD